jgi:hypothetical protein
MNYVSNGRVDIQGPNIDIRFALSDRVPTSSGNITAFNDAMTGNWYNTILSDAFFSAKNIQMIQNGIRVGVYLRSNNQYIIGEQNNDELKIIMRSIFLQYAKNQPTAIPGQISELNRQVLEYCIPHVYVEADGYMKYKYDVSTLVVPIARPILSYTNDKQLELKPWF